MAPGPDWCACVLHLLNTVLAAGTTILLAVLIALTYLAPLNAFLGQHYIVPISTISYSEETYLARFRGFTAALGIVFVVLAATHCWERACCLEALSTEPQTRAVKWLGLVSQFLFALGFAVFLILTGYIPDGQLGHAVVAIVSLASLALCISVWYAVDFPIALWMGARVRGILIGLTAGVVLGGSAGTGVMTLVGVMLSPDDPMTKRKWVGLGEVLALAFVLLFLLSQVTDSAALLFVESGKLRTRKGENGNV